jgi:serine protease AprX
LKKLLFCLLAALGMIGLFAGPGYAAPWMRAQRAKLLSAVPKLRIAADTDGNKIFDNLEARLASAAPDAALDVIVRYKNGYLSAQSQIAGHIRRRLALDRSVSARLTAGEIRQLAASNAVESIEANDLCYATREPSQASFGVTKARNDFGLNGDGDGNPLSYSSRDQTIAIIDTGIDGSHPDFANGKILFWQDYINNRPQPYDDDGHGTHVASIAAGRVVNGVGGVAPGAALIGLKVLKAQTDGSASGTLDVIASAVDWCIQNKAKYGISVLNLSLGGTTSSDGTDILSRALNRASDAGMVVCVAAGNEGPNPYTIGFAAAAANAITVGNMADTGHVGSKGERGFAVWTSSSRGPTADGRVKPDLCAPGVQILAARAGGGYVAFSGTSMSAPFVSGLAALMRQANPALTPLQVKAIMKETAVHFGPAGDNNDFGAGRLDGYAALARADGTVGTPPEVPSHTYIENRLAAANAMQRWDVQVKDTRFPIAATLIMQDPGTDFDLYLLNAAGTVIASSQSIARQEILGFLPTSPGTYTLAAFAYNGGGRYSLDVSAGTGSSQTGTPNRLAVFRPSTREWFVRNLSGQSTIVQFGGPEDQALPADYLGTGKVQLTVFRASTREWFIRSDSGSTIAIQYGGLGDIPVPADYLGLGHAQLAVFRPSTREWFIRNDNGGTVTYQFGALGDQPVPADYLKLGHVQVAVFRPSTSEWFIRNDTGGTVPFSWGMAGDQPIPGDYQGAGSAQIAVYRPSTSQFFLRSTTGQATVIAFGSPGDIPVPLDYTGTGRTQVAVYRPGTAEWFLRADNGDSTRYQWGMLGDLPIPAAYGFP